MSTSARPRQASVIGQGTEKLYYTDAYMTEFDATVLECRERARNGSDGAAPLYDLLLDR